MTAWVGAFCAYLAASFSLTMVIVAVTGQPPIHCRYLVPVRSAPGVFSCSEYPHPLVKP